MHPLSLITSTNLVLLFHEVSSKDWFRTVLKTIGKIYSFISINDIEEYYYRNKTFNNCCHICFDDGDRSFYDNVFPVLKETSIPATIFLSPKIIENGSNYWFQELNYIREHLGDELLKETISEVLSCHYSQIKEFAVFSLLNCMKLEDILKVIKAIKEKFNININKKYNITKNQLAELNKSELITIAAHTLNHPILSNETYSDSRMEISDSVKKLFGMIKKDVKHFAYPNGIPGLDYGTREQMILGENKIKLAFTAERGFFSKKINPFCIPRGALSGTGKENNVLILSRIILLPFWGAIRDKVRFRRAITEKDERREIKRLSIF